MANVDQFEDENVVAAQRTGLLWHLRRPYQKFGRL